MDFSKLAKKANNLSELMIDATKMTAAEICALCEKQGFEVKIDAIDYVKMNTEKGEKEQWLYSFFDNDGNKYFAYAPTILANIFEKLTDECGTRESLIKNYKASSDKIRFELELGTNKQGQNMYIVNIL